MKKSCRAVLLGFFVLCQLLLIENVKAQNCWSSLGSNLAAGVSHRPNDVYSLATYNGDLIVGGSFDTLNKYYGSVLAWDGTTWSNLGTGLKGRSTVGVYAMATYNGYLYVAGAFDTAGGVPVNNIAKWDGTTWSAVGSGINSGVYSLAFNNGILYAGGSFSLAGGTAVRNFAKWDGNLWSDVGGGVHGVINCLTVINNDIYLGGRFDSVGNISARNVAVWNGNAWSALDEGVGIPDQASNMAGGSIVDVIIPYQSNIYAAGLNLDSVRGGHVNNIAKWDGSSWTDVSGGVWNDIYSLFVYKGKLIAGGSFIRANGIDTIWNLAQWDGISWSGIGGGIPGGKTAISVMDTFNGGLFVGGYIDTVAGITVNGIAQYNCTTSVSEIDGHKAAHLFPNPANDIIKISIDNLLDKSTIQIYNLLGQQILQSNLSANQTELNLNGQAAGTYLYRITGENGENLATGKFVLQ